MPAILGGTHPHRTPSTLDHIHIGALCAFSCLTTSNRWGVAASQVCTSMQSFGWLATSHMCSIVHLVSLLVQCRSKKTDREARVKRA